MRHARPRSWIRPGFTIATVGLTASALAGFASGTALLPDSATGTATSVVADAATGKPAEAPDRVRSQAPEEVPPTADSDRPEVGQVDQAPQVALPAAPAPIVGADEIDPDWPADTRGDGCAAPVWPAKAESTPRVLLIGDSLFRNARALLEAEITSAGWAPTVRCWGARGSVWGVGQVERARELDQLPDTVIVSLGTNDIWWLGVSMEQAVDSMMAALGPDVTVFWVNLLFGPHGYDRLPEPGPANEVLEAKLAEYPNLRVIDFAGAFQEAQARGEPVGWLDGVHLNEAARVVRVETIVEELREYGASLPA